MAKMLPPYIDKNCKSSGERMLFDIFKNNEFTKRWIILHSLNLSQHTKRLYGEIDFLVMIPGGGLYVIEVKSGDIKCNGGIWQYTDRYGNTNSSNIGPFNQARDAMFSVRESIQKEFGKGHRFTKFLYGFMCAFPHICFDKHSIEYEPWQVLDKDMILNSTEDFFKNLVHNFIKKNCGQKWFSREESLPNSSDLNILCDFLRGDFERVRTVKDRLKEYDRQVQAYTLEQYRILDQIQLNQRSITQGSAGTGKTMIAIESAIRAASEGKKVFLTCFNRLIAEWMQNQVIEWKDKITVNSLHKYISDVSEGFDYDRLQFNNQNYFAKYLPSLLREIFQRGIVNKFDKLIIDEGQDLIREEYLSLFDSMIIGGLANGNWEIYGDFERQAIFAQLSKDHMLSLINTYSQSTKFMLKINCRNTKQIGEETSLLSGFEKPPFLLEHLEGVPVQYIFYTSLLHQSELISEQLGKLIIRGLPENELIIISPKRFSMSAVSSVVGYKIMEIKKLKDVSFEPKCFRFATVQSYKGMESNYIMITDVEDLSTNSAKSLLYVGMSRARYGLILLISESVRNQYRKILREKLQLS